MSHQSSYLAVSRNALLLTASALALSFGLPGVAFAQATQPAPQDGDPTTTQDVPSSSSDGNVSDGTEAGQTTGIIITGIRQRLESSQAIKRDADTFVDAVTAEDIGALPDRSVNETLQRIPGVTINRFQGQDDPDHFSVEGSNVAIRGLTYVRSEFNGRDAFSVNTGRSLGFNDVSPELLASVVVFKNATADRVEGGIAGLVDLRTRKAFDNRKLIVAGTLEGQYGDLREKLGYNGSVLLANTFNTPIGDIGALVSYGRSKLYSTAYGTQISDFTYRPALSTGDQINFLPRGGGTKSQDFDRGRQTFDASLQFESIDQRAKITLEYIRATSQQLWGEKVIETDLGANDGCQPSGAGVTFGSDGLLTSGVLAGDGSCNLQSFITREQDTKTRTQDYSINAELHPTDRLTLVLDGQYAKAHSDQIDMSVLGAVTPLFASIMPGDNGIPNVTQVNADRSPATQLTDIASYYYRAAMDHVEENDGREYAFRADAKYDIDSAFLRAVHIGGRYSDREQTRKYTLYNWANISEVWNGGTTPFTTTGPLAATQFNFPDFQRGDVATPGPGFYLDNVVQNYRNGSLQSALLAARSNPDNGWVPVDQRAGVLPGTSYLPGDINNSAEQTYAGYGRLDFGTDALFGGDAALSGNIGLRYVKTQFQTRGFITAPSLSAVFNNQSGNLTPATAFTFARAQCAAADSPANQPSYCVLSDDRLRQLIAFADGSATPVQLRNSFDDFLPSLNVNLRFNDRFIVRAAASRAMTRSDFGRSGFAVSLTPNAFAGGVDPATGALFVSNIDPNGNGAGVPLNGVRAWNYDFGLEYYFRPAASVTLNLFYKDLKDIAANGSTVTTFTNASGVSTDAQVNQQVNIGKGSVKGFEVAYQQFYDFLPGALSGVGFEGNYTFIDPSSFPNQVTEPRFTGLDLPLQNLSKHAFNVSALYEKYGISARATYNWRSRFLLIPRDVIYPYAPIYNEKGGQLDASIFYAVTPNIKLGLQANNLLDQTTQTLAQTSFNLGDGNQAGPLAPRSFFRNDRRFSFGVRVNF